MKLLRDVLSGGTTALGGWCELNNLFSAELMGRAGFDWIGIDMQHGLTTSFETLAPMVQILNQTDTPVLVRVPWKSDVTAIMHALDLGAQGIIVPMVDTPDEAATAAAACRYPPLGYRSWGPTRVIGELPGYPPDVANATVLCLVMIETKQAMDRLDGILEVSGVDGVYVGPADLCLSHGGALGSSDDLVQSLATRVLAACRKHGRIAAFHSMSQDQAVHWSRWLV